MRESVSKCLTHVKLFISCKTNCCFTCLLQVYKTRKLGRQLAVDNLCIGVPAGEVSVSLIIDQLKILKKNLLTPTILE